jgi:integrase
MAFTNLITDRYQLDTDTQAGNWLAMYLRNERKANRLDPVTLRILSGVSGAARLPVALLAATKCRWSELDHIDLIDLIKGEEVLVLQPKTGFYREIRLNASSFPIGVFTKLSNANPTRLGYDAVRHAVTQAIPYEILTTLDSRTSSTHIFRHLHATWMFLHKYPLHTISADLGHASELSVFSYLHVEAWSGILG